MEYKDVSTLVKKDDTKVEYRHRGGKRMFIVRGERAGRQMWQKVGNKRSIAGNLVSELTTVEQFVDNMMNSIDYSYDSLMPMQSSFALVEETVLLYKGNPEDLRFKQEVRVPFTDANNAGMSRSGVGRTLRRPYHGWTCTCWQCRGLKEPDREE